MDHEHKSHVDFSSSGVTNPFTQPLFLDLADIPRSGAGPVDFTVSSSNLTSDVYRSLGGGTSSYTEQSQPLSFMPVSHFPSKDLDIPFQPKSQYHWEDFQSTAAGYDKSKFMEDIKPRTETFSASSSTFSTPAVPPDLPDWIDPNYNFSSSMSPSELFAAMQTTLQSQSVDVESKPARYRLKCTAYPSECVLLFVVRIYRGKDKDCIVECQRRKGDILPFARIFRTLKGLVDPKIRDSTALPAAFADDQRVDADHAKETTQCLLLMAKSQFVDVQSKAVEALASLSSQDRSVQELLIKQGSVDMLLDGCVAKPEGVHRPALTALANLADGRADVCRAIAGDKALRSLSEQLTSSKDNCPQVVRECARVFTAVGQSFKNLKTSSASSSLDIDCTFVSMAVQNFSCSKDPLTLKRAREIEECFDLESVC